MRALYALEFSQRSQNMFTFICLQASAGSVHGAPCKAMGHYEWYWHYNFVLFLVLCKVTHLCWCLSLSLLLPFSSLFSATLLSWASRDECEKADTWDLFISRGELFQRIKEHSLWGYITRIYTWNLNSYCFLLTDQDLCLLGHKISLSCSCFCSMYSS